MKVSNLIRTLLLIITMNTLFTQIAAADVTIDKTNFPDPNFRAWLQAQPYGSDDLITDDEIANITTINVSSMNIEDLMGIEYFTALTDLHCNGNQLKTLDVSKNTALKTLNCNSNQLTALDVSKNIELTRLICSNNPLTTLDVSKNTVLTDLSCSNNLLTTLDISKNTTLTGVYCHDNQLTTLDVSKNTVLTDLSCSNNLLTTLDVSKNTGLKTLYCSGNQLTALDVSKNIELTQLICSNNPLTTLDVSKNTALTDLQCVLNQLTTLDVSNNTALTSLWCYNNQLATLNVSNNTALTDMLCYSNQLTTLDVSKNTALTRFIGHMQTPPIFTLSGCGSDYSTTINLDNTTTFSNAGVSYTAGKLTSNDENISQTSFSAATGLNTFTISGTLKFAYEAICKDYYVKVNGSGSGSGSSWKNAMSNEAFARMLPVVPDDVTFHIEEGIYHPIYDADRNVTIYTSDKTFLINSNVTLIGGYPANVTDETKQPDPETNKTIFDGNINGEKVNTMIDILSALKVHLKGLYIENTNLYVIKCKTEELHLDHVTISNYEGYGGCGCSAIYGDYNYGKSGQQIITIENSSFCKNNGIFIYSRYWSPDAKITMNNVKIEENSAHRSPLIFVPDAIEALIMNNVKAKNNTTELISAEVKNIIISNSEFDNNQYDGDFITSYAPNFTISDSKITNNISNNGVAGIKISAYTNSATIERTIFDGNKGATVAHLHSDATMTSIDNCVFKNGVATNSELDFYSGTGGVLCNNTDATIKINKTIFENNKGNIAHLDIQNAKDAEIDNCIFSKGEGTNAIYFDSQNAKFSNSAFYENITQGTAISWNQRTTVDSQVDFTNNTFAKNEAAGGSLLAGNWNSYPSYINNTIVGNKTSWNTIGGLYARKVIGNIILGNVVSQIARNVFANSNEVEYNIMPLFADRGPGGSCGIYIPRQEGETNIFVEPKEDETILNTLYPEYYCTEKLAGRLLSEIFQKINTGEAPYLATLEGEYDHENVIFNPKLEFNGGFTPTVALKNTVLPNGKNINCIPTILTGVTTDQRRESRNEDAACIGAYEGERKFLPTNEYYVKENGAGLMDGSDWENAMSNAIFANYLPLVPDNVTFHIAQGTYKPIFQGTTPSLGILYETNSAVTLIGGYRADITDETELPDPQKYETIFSGDMLGYDTFNKDNDGNMDFGSMEDNLSYILLAKGETAVKNIVFQGAVTSALMLSSSNFAVKNHTVSYCVFRNNNANDDYRGAAIWQSQFATSEISNSRFYQNKGTNIIRRENYTAASIDSSIFSDNQAKSIIFFTGTGSGDITNTTFTNNIAENGIISNGYGLTLRNNTFTNNTAGDRIVGGGYSLSLQNNTFLNNNAEYISNGGFYVSMVGNIFLNNVLSTLSGFNTNFTFQHNLYLSTEENAGYVSDTDLFIDKKDIRSILDGAWDGTNFTPYLKNNGGFTPTVALKNTTLPNGKKINCIPISLADVTTDQRGVERRDMTCIGAYEADKIFLLEYYVKVEAAGIGDGSSWKNAMSNETFAEYLPIVPDDVTFHIAAGTYYPVYDASGQATSTNSKTFGIRSNVTLIGGYRADITDESEQTTDPENNETIFDGTIGDEKVYQLIYAYSDSLKVRLSGLHIDNSEGYGICYYSRGSELYLDYVSISNIPSCAVNVPNALVLEVKNSSFEGNYRVIDARNNPDGKVTLNNVKIERTQDVAIQCSMKSLVMNHVEAKNNNGLYLIQALGKNATITNSEFKDNRCYNDLILSTVSDNFTISNSKITNNISENAIAGIRHEHSDSKLTVGNTTFDRNEGTYAVHLYSTAKMTLIDSCVFKNGVATNDYSSNSSITAAGGILYSNTDGTIKITKTIFENNKGNVAHLDIPNAKDVFVDNCIFRGGEGNNIIKCFAPEATISNSAFYENICNQDGSYYIFNISSANTKHINNTIVNNKGYSLFHSGSWINNTIAGNQLSDYFAYGSPKEVIGNIFIGNSSKYDMVIGTDISSVKYNLMPIFAISPLNGGHYYALQENETNIFVQKEYMSLEDFANSYKNHQHLIDKYDEINFGEAPYLAVLEGEYDYENGIFKPKLEFNDGFTPTVALTGTIFPNGKPINSLPTSISGVKTDQRGVTRNELAACIGAYEIGCGLPQAEELSIATNATLCRGEVSKLYVNGIPSNQRGIYKYEWLFDNVELVSQSTNSDTIFIRVLAQIPAFTITLRLHDVCGEMITIDKEIPVNGIGDVSFDGLEGASYCVNATPVQLTGTPEEGIFSINGIDTNTNEFDPSSIKESRATIRYRILDPLSSCYNYDEKTVDLLQTDLENITIDLTPTPTSCTLANDGKIEASVTEGGQEYQYSWRKSGEPESLSVTNILQNIGVGDYILTLTDDNGCFTEKNAAVSSRMRTSELRIDNASATGDICKNLRNKGITASFSGNESGEQIAVVLTYGDAEKIEYSDQTEGEVYFTGLGTGEYNVGIRYAANGCEVNSSANKTVRIESVIELEAQFTSSSVTCSGANDGFIQAVTVSGGKGPYRYYWKKAGESEYTESESVKYNRLGLGTYSSLIVDANGCELETKNLQVTVHEGENSLEINSVTPMHLACFDIKNGRMAVNYSGNTDEKEVSISLSSGTTLLTQTTTSESNNLVIYNLSDAVYQVKIYYTGAEMCPLSGNQTREVAINSPERMTVAFNIVGVSCESASDGLVEAQVEGGRPPYTYQWFTSDWELLQDNLDVTDPERLEEVKQGDYISRVTDSNRCFVISGPIVPVKDPSDFELKLDDVATEKATCLNTPDGKVQVYYSGNRSGQEIVATIAGDNSFVWERTSRNLTDILTFEFLPVGTYQVRLFPRGAEDCDTDNNTQSATVSSLHVLRVNIDKIGVSCQGASDGRLIASIEEGRAPYTYEWLTEDNNSIQVNSTDTDADKLEKISLGKYISKVTDANGCQFVSGLINLPIRGIAESGLKLDRVTPTHITCYNAGDGNIQVDYSGNGDKLEVSVKIFKENTLILEETSYKVSDAFTFDRLSVGTYEVRLSYAGAEECEWDDNMKRTVGITQPDRLQAEFNITGTLCVAATDGYITAIPHGGTAPLTYTWYSENPLQEEREFITTGTDVDVLPNLGTGKYACLITDANNCTFQSEILEVNEKGINPIITEAFVTGDMCKNSPDKEITVSFSGNTLERQIAIVLTHGDNEKIEHTNKTAGAIYFSELGAGEYNIGIRYAADGCEVDANAQKTVRIKNIIELQADFTRRGVTCTEASDGYIQTAVSGGTAPFNYFWKKSDEPDYTKSESVKYSRLGLGTYSSLIVDANDCELETGNLQVSVREEENSLEIGSITPTHLVCFDTKNGKLDVNYSGNTDKVGVTISISSTDKSSTHTTTKENGNEIFEDLPDGVYQVKIYYTGAEICLSDNQFQEIEIDTPEPLTTEFDITGVSCEAASDGLIVARMEGGIPPYTYQWLTSDLEPLPSQVASSERLERRGMGGYVSRVTDSNGCRTTSEPINIPVKDPSDFDLKLDDVTTEKATCLNTPDGKVLVRYSGNKSGQEIVAMITGGNSFVQEKTSRNLTGILTFESLPVGTYQVRLFPRGAENCDTDNNTQSATVSSLHVLRVNIDKIGVSCQGASDGRLIASIEEGRAPYTYEWLTENNNSIRVNSTDADSDKLEKRSLGKYISKVTDGNGCQFVSDPVDLPVRDITGSGLELGDVIPANVTCYDAGDGNLQVYYSGNNDEQEVSVRIFAGNTLKSEETSWGISGIATFESLPAGTYKVQLSYAGAEECDPDDNMKRTVEITQPGRLQAVFDIEGTLCANSHDGYITVRPSGGTGQFTYTWYSENTSQEERELITTGTGIDKLLNLRTGKYSCLITDANNCSFQSEILEVNKRGINPIITNAFATGDICKNLPDKEITVSFSGNTLEEQMIVVLTYGTERKTEQTGGTTGSVYFSGLGAGEYNIGIRYAADGCEVDANAQKTVRIKNIIELQADFTRRGVTCTEASDGYIQAAVSGGTAPFNYFWKKSDKPDYTKSDSERFSLIGTGMYDSRIVDANGCILETKDLAISVRADGNNLLRGTIDYRDLLCAGINDGRLNIPYSGNTDKASVTISVHNNDGTLLGAYNFLKETGNAVLENLTNGIHHIRLYYTGAEICPLNDNQYVAFTINAPPPALSADVEVRGASCEKALDAHMTATVTGGKQPYTYEWFNSGKNPVKSDQLNPERIEKTSAGSYTLKVTDKNNCLLTKEVKVPVWDINESGLKLDRVTSGNLTCYGDNSGILRVSYLGNTDAREVVVNILVGNIVKFTETSKEVDDDFTFESLPAGTYDIRLSYPGAESCDLSDNLKRRVVITQPDQLKAEFNITGTLCATSNDGRIIAMPQGGIAPLTYTWYSEGSSPEEQEIIASAIDQIGLPNRETGKYSCLITDASNCSFQSGILEVKQRSVRPLSLNSLIYDQYQRCRNVNSQVEVALNPYTGSDNAYITLSISGEEVHSITLEKGNTKALFENVAPGRYLLQVKYDGSGCEAAFSDYIEIIELTQELSIETIETPAQTCFNEPNGSIEFAVHGIRQGQTAEVISGTGTKVLSPYKFEKETGYFRTERLISGAYTLKVTDPCGNIVEEKVQLEKIAPAVISIIETDNNLTCSYDKGFVKLQVKGDFTKGWLKNNNKGEVFEVVPGEVFEFSNLAKGKYTYTYTYHRQDDASCTDRFTQEVTINAPNPLSVSFDKKDVACTQGYLYFEVTGETGKYAMQFNGDDTEHTDNKLTVSELNEGSYSFTAVDPTCPQTQFTNVFEIEKLTELPVLAVSRPAVTDEFCYRGNNGIIQVSYSGGVKELVKVKVEKEGSVLSDQSTAKAKTFVIENLAPGTYTVTIFYDVADCELMNEPIVFTDVIVKPILSPLKLIGKIEKTNPTCINEPNGTVTFDVAGWSTQHTVMLKFDDNRPNEVIRPKPEDEDKEAQTAHFELTNRAGGSFTLFIEDRCGNKLSEYVEFKGIEPYTLTFKEEESITFVPCIPYDYGRIVFEYGGGIYTDRSIGFEYKVIETTPQYETVTITKYNSKEETIKVMVLDENGFPARDDEDNILYKEEIITVLVPYTVTENIRVEDKKETKKVYKYLSENKEGNEYFPAQKNGNTFTCSGLNKNTYTVVYMSTEENCSDRASLSVDIEEPSRVQVLRDILPVSCQGFEDGMVTIYPGRGGAMPEYFLSKKDGNYTYYKSQKVADKIELIPVNNVGGNQYELHEQMEAFSKVIWEKKISESEWKVVNPVTPSYQEKKDAESIHDQLFSFYDNNNNKIKTPVWHLKHLPKYTIIKKDEAGNDIEYFAVGAITLANLGKGIYRYSFEVTDEKCIDEHGKRCQYSEEFEIGDPEHGVLRITKVEFDTENAKCYPKKRQVKVNVEGGWGSYVYSLKDVRDTGTEDEGELLGDDFTGGEFSLEKFTNNTYSGSFASRILAPGTYNLYVMDQYGCVVKHPVDIVVSKGNITVTAPAVIEATCPNDTLMPVTLTVTGGSGSYKYETFSSKPELVTLLKTIDTNNGRFEDKPGTHGYFVSDNGSGCGDYVEVEIKDVRDTIFLSRKEYFDVKCHGDHSGEAEIWVKGKNTPFSFYHALGKGTPVRLNNQDYEMGTTTLEGTTISSTYYSFFNLAAGKHYLQAVDSKGCTEEFEFELKEPDELKVTAQGSPICEGAIGDQPGNIIFAQTLSGGVPPYEYSLNNNPFQKDKFIKVTANKGDKFDYYVKDKNGCIASSKQVGLSPEELTVTVDFLATTYRYNSDVMVLVDLSSYAGFKTQPDSVVYKFYEDAAGTTVNEKMRQEADKKPYTHLIVKKDKNGTVTEEEELIPDASKYEFIVFSDTDLSRKLMDKNSAGWLESYDHYIGMTAYIAGCVYETDIRPLIIKNGDLELYKGGNLNQKDIMNLQIAPNPWTQGNLEITITFGSKVDHTVTIYNELGVQLGSKIEGSKDNIDNNLTIKHTIDRSRLSSNSGAHALVVLVNTDRDAAGKVVVVQ